MKILFIGLGSIGLRHAKIINQLYPDYEIYALSRRKHNIAFVKDLHFSWDTVDFIKPQIAFICNPTYLHINSAIECAKRGIHLFIEKPLCSSLDNLFELLNIIHTKNLIAYVAYPFRFHSGLEEKLSEILLFTKNDYSIFAKTNIERWGKKSYSFDRNLGGGVLFELSHEIDLAEWIFGKIVDIRGTKEKHSKYNIYGDAMLRVIHESGIEGKIQLSLTKEFDYRAIQYNNIFYQYNAEDEMYKRQMKYFFENLDNEYLMNNIFDASELFCKIIKMENR